MFWPKKINFETVRLKLVSFTRNCPVIVIFMVNIIVIGDSFWISFWHFLDLYNFSTNFFYGFLSEFFFISQHLCWISYHFFWISWQLFLDFSTSFVGFIANIFWIAKPFFLDGREGRSLKGCQLEVGARRAPRLQCIIISLINDIIIMVSSFDTPLNMQLSPNLFL